MRYAKDMNGKHTAWIKRYQVGETISNLGVPLTAPGANNAGVMLGTTTSLSNMIGVAYGGQFGSTVTYTTSQPSGDTIPPSENRSAERLVSICIIPYALYELLLSGGATAGTALTLYDVTTASTDGLTVTTGDAWNSPTYDEGTVWGYDGANAGQARKITSVSATAATVTVPFDRDLAVGENFMRCPYNPGQSSTVQLTSDLRQADTSIAVGTGAGMRCVELQLLDQGREGRTKSRGLFLPTSHIFR